jgi:hypothetical protein
MARYREINDPDLPDDIDLPDDLTGREKVADDLLQALGIAIAEKRDAAIAARKTSGIEDVWLKCEEAYLGIDNANRGEFANAKWSKPTSMQGPVTANNNSRNPEDVRSTAYVRLTSRYVDAATAKLGEILLPIDDKSFSLKPMPIPELTTLTDDQRAVLDDMGRPMLRPLGDDEVVAPAPAAGPAGTPGGLMSGVPGATPPQGAAPGGAPGQPAGAPPGTTVLTVADIANKRLDALAESAEKAETRIYNWLTSCSYPKEARKVLFDSARAGVGVLKAPTPAIKTSMALKKGSDGQRTAALEIKKKIVPVAKWVDFWNLFPDGGCGEDIHAGAGIRERDFLLAKQLEELKEEPGYLPDQIDKVLKEGPNKKYTEGRNPSEVYDKDRFEVWYCYDTLTREEIAATNAVGVNGIPKDQEKVFAIVTLVNDTCIKADLNPLESGRFPYNAMPWSRRAGSWAGVGVGEQVDMPQRAVNGATRALFDNAGIAAGTQIIMRKGVVIPADGSTAIVPNKLWYLLDDANVDDVQKAFAAIEFPDQRESLMAIIEYCFKLAEEACNIPLVTQGMSDKNTPETFGGAQIQDSNANTLLRSVGEIYDDFITDPMIHGFYEWLLLDPEVPDDEKEEFEIHAHGSAALVERAIQVQTLQDMGNLVGNPAFRINPAKWAAEMLRSKRLDPGKLQYTEEEFEEIQSNTPPPLPIAVAQVRAKGAVDAVNAKVEGELQLSQQEMQQEQQRLQAGGTTPHEAMAEARIEQAKINAASNESIQESRAQAELAYAQTEREMARDNAIARQQEIRDKRDMMILEYSLKNNLTLQQVKAELAKTAMQEHTKQVLAGAENQLTANQNAEDRTHEMTKHMATLNAEAQLAANAKAEAPAQDGNA